MTFGEFLYEMFLSPSAWSVWSVLLAIITGVATLIAAIVVADKVWWSVPRRWAVAIPILLVGSLLTLFFIWSGNYA